MRSVPINHLNKSWARSTTWNIEVDWTEGLFKVPLAFQLSL